MQTHIEAFELATLCARHSRIAANKQVARELWKMAQEYKAEAVKLHSGWVPDLGDPPQGYEP